MIESAFVLRREDAIRGSEALRNAILHAKGHPLPAERTRIRHRKLVTKPTTRKPAPRRAAMDACPTCCTPIGINRRMIADIQRTVAAYYGILPHYMTSGDRRREVTTPRQVAIFLSSQLTKNSIADIGRRFNRDHSTVIHSIKLIERQTEEDEQLAFDVTVLQERLSL